MLGFVGVTDCGTCDTDGSNIGAGEGSVYSTTSILNGITTLNFRTLLQGTGITLTTGVDTVTIATDTSGTLVNVGAGIKILVDPVVTDNELKTLTAGVGILIADNLDEINISSDGTSTSLGSYPATDYVRTASNEGTGTSIIKKATASSDSNLEFYGIKAGNGIVVHRVLDDIIIADANGGNYVSTLGDYTVEMDDAIVGVSNTDIVRVITLTDTAIAGPGKVITVKDESFGASTNNVVVQGTAGQLLDGGANIPITVDGGHLTVYTDGVNWFNISSTGTASPVSQGIVWEVISIAHTASDGENLIGDTTDGSFTITLPASPSIGDQVRIKSTIANTNNLIVGRDGSNILGDAQDYTINADNLDITFVYINATIGWTT